MSRIDVAARTAALSDLVATQDDLVTAGQLRALGFNSASMAHRLAGSCIWQLLLPGTYLTTTGAPTAQQRRRAALLYGGPESMLTGFAALTLHGSRVAARHERGGAHLLVPHHRKRSSSGFVVVERTSRWPEPGKRQELRVAPPARAALDAARRMSQLSDVRALLSDVVQSGLAPLVSLSGELAAGQRRGSRLARRALTDLDAGTRSAPEAALRDAWLRSGLAEPLWNATLRTSSGEFLARPDAYLPEVGLAVEVESREFHYSEADWRRTMQRQARMTSRGVVVLQFPPSRVTEDAVGVMSEVRATSVALASRPLPRVIVDRAA